MVVAFQPGGSVKDKRIILRWQEKLPREYNIPQTEVFMEGEDYPLPWTLMKPVGELLEEEFLEKVDPAKVETNVLDLNKLPEDPNAPPVFEHVDIIRMDEDKNES